MIPVVVVLGLPGAGKSTWLERELADRPAGARWAVLGQDAVAPAVPGLLRQTLGPGCACCALRPALGQALNRVLRSGPWDRLLLEADGATHPERLVAALRESPFAAALSIESMVLVIDGRQSDPWLAAISANASARKHEAGAPPVGPKAGDPPAPLLHERRIGLIGAATQVVINRPRPGAEELAAALAAAGPFGRSVLLEDPPAAPRRWTPPPGRVLARWPAVPAFDRRALRTVLLDWSRRHPGLSVRGAWPTARAWYEWTVRPGTPEQWSVSAYCLETRLEVSFPQEAPDTRPSSSQAAAMADGRTAVPGFSASEALAHAELVAAIERLRTVPVAGETGPRPDVAAP